MEKVKAFHAAKNASDAATLVQQAGLPSLYIVNDFLERNATKYAKVRNIVDEVIQFPAMSIVEFKPNEQGYRPDDGQYLVLRVKKMPNGRRQYWLLDMIKLRSLPTRQRRTIKAERKVMANSLCLIRQANSAELNALSIHRLPKPI